MFSVKIIKLVIIYIFVVFINVDIFDNKKNLIKCKK